MPITVASFNVRNMTYEAGDPERDWVSVRAVVAAQHVAASGAAIVGLQEAYASQDTTNGQAAILRGHLNTITGGDWKQLTYSGQHTIIWDDTVLEQTSSEQQIAVNEDPYPGETTYRRMGWATWRVRDTGQEFLFANTHLQHNSADMREESAHIIADKLDAERGSLPVVLVGDFNASAWRPNRDPYPILWQRLYLNMRGWQNGGMAVAGAPYDSFHGYDPYMVGKQQGRWIDGILLSGVGPAAGGQLLDFASGSSLPLRTPLPSDHNLIWCQLLFSGDENPDVPGGAETITGPGDPLPAAPVEDDTTVEVFAGELVTGKRLRTLPVSSCRWSVAINEAGQIEAEVPLRSLSAADRVELLTSVEPWRCYLAVQVGRQVMEAGPVQSHRYNESTGSLTIRAAGLWSWLSYRNAFQHFELGTGVELRKTRLTYRNLSLGTIAKRLIQEAQKHTPYPLPIVLPPDEVGTHEREYLASEIPVLGEKLRELTQVIGGPDIEFQPRLRDDGSGIYWLMRTGNGSDPLLHQQGEDWFWDLSPVRGQVVDLEVDVDASNRVNRALVQGAGYDESIKLYRVATSSEWDRGYPLLEQTYPHTTVNLIATLRDHGRAAIEQGSRPLTTWRLVVRADEKPTLGQYRPGDYASVHIPEGHVFLTPGRYRARVASFSHEVGSSNVQINLEPTLEVR